MQQLRGAFFLPRYVFEQRRHIALEGLAHSGSAGGVVRVGDPAFPHQPVEHLAAKRFPCGASRRVRPRQFFYRLVIPGDCRP
ncbi:hypothetical protein GGER_38630 [Serratia rubidaea]